MRHSICRPSLLITTVFVSVIVIVTTAVVLLVGYSAEAASQPWCSGVQIRPGNDLDAVVNRDPGDRATTFCVSASPSGTTYNVSDTVRLGPGDRLLGQPGQAITRGPASYGVPTVKLRGGASLEKVIELRGTNQLRWLDVSGGVKGIAASQASPSTLMEYLRVHDTSRTGITSMNGRLLRSELFQNGTDRRWWGHSASAVKGQAEYEAAYNYVHDNPANGIWCDVGCRDGGSATPNGFWAHDNLLVSNGRWGVRYEFSPVLPSGKRAAGSTALIERNEIHANGWQSNKAFGGASMWDAQNATFRANSFGAKTVGGVSYAANTGQQAILFFDSQNRTDLYNGDAVGNSLGGETIEGCEKPDNIVYCSDNN